MLNILSMSFTALKSIGLFSILILDDPVLGYSLMLENINTDFLACMLPYSIYKNRHSLGISRRIHSLELSEKQLKENNKILKTDNNMVLKTDNNKVLKIDNRISFEVIKGVLVIVIKDVKSTQDYKDLLSGMKLIINRINSVNSKGFVNSGTIIPVVDDFADLFIEKDEKSENYERSQASTIRVRFWVYNLILINIYQSCIHVVAYLKTIESSVEESDLLSDYRSFVKKIYSLLDPSIRRTLQKRGITATLNIFAGYDTEYQLESERKNINKLLSYQIAVNSRVYVKIPIAYEFKSGWINPQTSEKRNEQRKNSLFASLVESSIVHACKEIRVIQTRESDVFMSHILNVLKSKNYTSYVSDDNSEVFSLPLSEVSTYIGYKKNDNEPFTFEKLLNLIDKHGIEKTDASIISDILLKTCLCENNNTNNKNTNNKNKEKEKEKMPTKLTFDKRLKRTTIFYKGERISISLRKVLYVCAHLTNADLSILSDFDSLKERLDLVGQYFITTKPLKYESYDVHIRDTMLLTPAGSRSLEEIGKMYGEKYKKISVSHEYKERMEDLLNDDPVLFESYAIQDSIITLKHINEMEIFSFSELKRTGVPLTLSSIGKNYVINDWKCKQYTYQVSESIKLGNPGQVFTPKGLDTMGKLGSHLGYYIANYKGGRNESFMYGIDRETIWYDYDLTSAYTTCMAFLGNPIYRGTRLLNYNELIKLKDEDILTSYIIINTGFSFPPDVKYPSIPVFVDKNTTVYPSKGIAYLTGPEYLLARSQRCKFSVKSVVLIPFEVLDKDKRKIRKSKEGIECFRDYFLHQPFFSIIKTIQENRAKYSKGTLGNSLWKNIGNGIYGNVVSGMSDKKRFDIKTLEYKRVDASILTNPVMASWTTAFIRSVIGECLHNIHLLGGKVVSTTTDGFITNIEDLESKILGLEKGNTLFKLFKQLRRDLTDNKSDESLELKKRGKGIISWTTRGQLGIESNIKATTGFQNTGVSSDLMVSTFADILKSESKQFEYILSSLRSGKEIFDRGGHTVMKYRDQTFRLVYDNRRIIQDEKEEKKNKEVIYERLLDSEPLENKKKDCNYERLLDSEPLENKKDCNYLRKLSVIARGTYDRATHTSKNNAYKTNIETSVRTFVKGFLSEKPMFGLKSDDFKCYSEIQNFLKEYKPTSKLSISKQCISNWKHRKCILRNVPHSKANEEFAKNVKKRFPHFEIESFFKN